MNPWFTPLVLIGGGLFPLVAAVAVAGVLETSRLVSNPRVLVVAARDERVAALCAGLDSRGWPTVTARSVAGAVAALRDFRVEAVVIEAEGFDLPGLCGALRIAERPRRLPILAVCTPGDDLALPPLDDTGADFVATAMPHPVQAANRLEQMVRGAVAEDEVELRRETFRLRGVAVPEAPVDDTPLRILAAGAPDRRFLALSNALTGKRCEVVAAPTPYPAFDYLHEQPFDAAILWGADDHAPALSIASGMKRNTRLYHIPIALYLRGPADDLDELYGRGFAEIAPRDTAELDLADRVHALAVAHRRHQNVRAALDAADGTALTDGATGLFKREVFAGHLARLSDAMRQRRQPLSVCVLRIVENPALVDARAGGWLDKALPQIGAMVSRLVRAEDMPARLGAEVFALALPATVAAEARVAAERIAAVIGCTAFDAGPDRSPFVTEFTVGCAELRPDESPAALLDRASADLDVMA